jgi:hypothetical protein
VWHFVANGCAVQILGLWSRDYHNSTGVLPAWYRSSKSLTFSTNPVSCDSCDMRATSVPLRPRLLLSSLQPEP